jgi:hypothetical protein
MAEDKQLTTTSGLVPKTDKYIEQLAQRTRDLESGGYYKNVRSPEEYDANKEFDDDLREQGQDLDLTDEEKSRKASKKEAKEDEEYDGKLEPKKFWGEHIVREFENCTDKQKSAWLNSFKIIEKNYAKRVGTLEDEIRLSKKIMKAVEPARAGIEKQGYTLPDYIGTLVSFDNLASVSPAKAIARLWASSGLTYEEVYNAVQEQGQEASAMKHVAPYLEPLQQEVALLKRRLGEDGEPEDEAEALDQAQKTYKLLEDFYKQRDGAGKELYPGAMDNIKAIIEELDSSPDCTLIDAYERVMSGSPSRKGDEQDIEMDSQSASRPRRVMTEREKEEEMLNRKLRQILRS